MFNHNQSSWTFDQHKAYAAEQERRARQLQQVQATCPRTAKARRRTVPLRRGRPLPGFGRLRASAGHGPVMQRLR